MNRKTAWFLSVILVLLITVATASAANENYSLVVPLLGEARTNIRTKTSDKKPGPNTIEVKNTSQSRGSQLSFRWRRWSSTSNKFVDSGNWTAIKVGDQNGWTSSSRIKPGWRYCVAMRHNLSRTLNAQGTWWY